MLFSIPVGCKINGDFENTMYSHNCIQNESYNADNVSDDKFILDKYPHLKKWILSEVNVYAKQALSCTNELRITQSWSIIGNSSLQIHQHPNSIISGAYYINADQYSSPLTFAKPYVQQLKWETDQDLLQSQDWNWDVVNFYPEIGKLILFPSYLGHGVVSNNRQSNRCVLSFNTWFSNPMGSIDSLTFLD